MSLPDLASDLIEIEADIPQSITWQGTSYPAVVMSPTESRAIDDLPGWLPEADCLLVIRKSLLTAEPMIGQKLTYNGDTYRIESVELDSVEAAYNLQLSSSMGR